jgi:hypothetical protein
MVLQQGLNRRVLQGADSRTGGIIAQSPTHQFHQLTLLAEIGSLGTAQRFFGAVLKPWFVNVQKGSFLGDISVQGRLILSILGHGLNVEVKAKN